MEGKKQIPTGVKVISILYYISSGLGIIFGLIFLFGAGLIASLIPILGFLGGGIFVIIAIIVMGMSVLSFFIGRGLWKAQKWARIIAIVFSGISAVLSIITFVQGSFANGIINLAISGIIGGYLLFNKKVKQIFE